MTNMFKKSLVAIALTGIASSAMAAELTAGTTNVASEWANTVAVGATNSPLAGATVEAADIQLTLNAAYTPGDTVTLTFTGNSLITATLPNSVAFAGGTGGGTANLGLISSSVNASGDVEVTYRVTQVGPDGDTTGATGTFFRVDNNNDRIGGLEFMPRRLGDGVVTVSFAAATSTGQVLDTSGDSRSVNLIRVGSQFGSIGLVGVGNTGLLNETIDVASGRLQFDNFAAGSSIADGNFNVVPSRFSIEGTSYTFSPDAPYIVSVEDIEYTLSGDFSWLLDEEGELDKDYDYLTVSNCATFEVSTDEIVAACGASTSTSFNPTFTVAAGNDRVIPVQSFGLEAVVSYGAAGQAGTVSRERVAGAWGLNGSNVEVAYMPYSGNITQVINVTNRSNQTGDISVTAIDEAGRRFDLGVIAQSDARSITPIAGQIRDALSADAGIDLASNNTTRRYALEITTNAPHDKVEVYTAYNVGQTGARLVVNGSNGGAVSKSDD